MDFELEVIPDDADPDEYDECAECGDPTRFFHEDNHIWVHTYCLGAWLGAWLGSRWP